MWEQRPAEPGRGRRARHLVQQLSEQLLSLQEGLDEPWSFARSCVGS